MFFKYIFFIFEKKHMSQATFIHQLPINSNRAKLAFFSLMITLVLCIAGIIISRYYWEGHTTWMYSLKYQTNVEVGWPVTLNSWSWGLSIAIVLCAPFLYYMQDWKNPSLAMTSEVLFINQQLIRNTYVPIKNIASITKDKNSYTIQFKHPEEIVAQQIFLFKPFVKSNLAQNNVAFSSIYTAGNLDEFMHILQTKLS
jgi:hypothetical protein